MSSCPSPGIGGMWTDRTTYRRSDWLHVFVALNGNMWTDNYYVFDSLIGWLYLFLTRPRISGFGGDTIEINRFDWLHYVFADPIGLLSHF
jgi:hypothetical protein